MTDQIKHMAVERARPLTTLLASAKRLTTTQLRGGARAGAKRQITQASAWQDDAWEMFDLVGEERYLVTTLANRISKARLYIGTLSDDPLEDPTPVTDPQIASILQSIGRSPAGRAQVVERMAINLYVAGDGWLVGIPDHILTRQQAPEGSIPLDSFHWRFMSVSEVSSKTDTTVTLQLDANDKLDVNPDDIYLIRVWRPHPRRYWEADCATRASLPVLKELAGLTMYVSAQIDSRLAGAGVFLVPASAQKALQQNAQISDEQQVDQFTDALIEAMSTAIQNRGSAAAIVPLVVTVPDDSIEKFKYMSFAAPLEGAAPALREESIRRLALGQDAPPEVLLGTSGMNHWGGWLVQEDVVSTHIEPPLALMCDAITMEFLWPVLEQMQVRDFEKYVIWYDVSHLVVRPNRGTDALALHERGAISDKAVRLATGFDEGDAPEAQEIDDQVAEIVTEMFKANPALITRPGLGVLMRQLKEVLQGIEPEVYDQRKAAAEAAREGETAPGAVDSTAAAAPSALPAPTPTPTPAEGMPQTQNAPPAVTG